jgi:trans-aconitate methyltransferase|tara:strand:- start:972 stop:1598 length:627 start_codon:yes stop_codon:yes gene_type:complete
MDILKLNKKAWNAIGSKAASKTIKDKKYKAAFTLFCKKLPKHAQVLDLGCGPGLPFTQALVKHNFEVLGIDFSKEMIAAAKKNVPEATFKMLSMTDIDYKQEFDGIFSGYSMLCLDPKQFKRTATRITKALKPNGFLFLSLNEPGPDGHHPRESYIEILRQKLYSRPYTEKEIQKAFPKMKIKYIDRHLITTKEYGDEHTLIAILQKT